MDNFSLSGPYLNHCQIEDSEDFLGFPSLSNYKEPESNEIIDLDPPILKYPFLETNINNSENRKIEVKENSEVNNTKLEYHKDDTKILQSSQKKKNKILDRKPKKELAKSRLSTRKDVVLKSILRKLKNFYTNKFNK